MINLQDFISETLTQITNGVRNAQTRTADTDAHINPVDLYLGSDATKGRMFRPKTYQPIETVHFDIAVTAEEATDTKGGIGVFVGSIGLGSQGQSDARNSSVSRIQFSVPVLLPPGTSMSNA